MAARTYSFEPPRWQPASRMARDTAGALVAGLGWVAIYVWLGRRLWSDGRDLREPLNLILVAALILSGVLILFLLRNLARRWRRQLRPSAWRALNQRQLLTLTPGQFEAYVASRVFERQGYRVTNTPDTRDGGIDILLTDSQGRMAVVQCKRYRSAVGEEVVRDLYGTMLHAGADCAYLVTTGAISRDAQRWAGGKAITLIDGAELERLARAVPHDD